MPDDYAEISQIKLPNNNVYHFKDEVARNLITSNGTFRIAWNGSSAPVATSIPQGISVVYQGNTTVGSLTAGETTLKDFYLVHSSTEIGNDIYDEYVTVKSGTTASPIYIWEKIGDTQIQLSEVVTGVTLTQATANVVTDYASPTTASVIGPNSTFTVTNPTVTVTPTLTYIKAEASLGSVTYNSKQTANAITGFPDSETANYLNSLTVTNNQKLVRTTITGVSGSVTASKVSQGTSQTTLDGGTTANSTTNAWFKGWEIQGETLTLKGVMPTTQTTTQITIDEANVTVPKAATSSTTVATGALATNGSGDAVVTNVTSTCASAVSTLGTATTASVLKDNTTLKFGSNQTITLSTTSTAATGEVQVATGISSTTATGGSVAWNSKDSKTVLTGLGTATTATVLTSATLSVTKAQ